MRLAAIIVVLVASAAHADPAPDRMKREAREHFDRATTLYESGDFAGAIGELELGRHIEPHPHFQYALGQAYRKLGDCKHAVQYYRAFLATLPSESWAAKVQTNITRCEAEADATPRPSVTPPTPPIAAPPAATDDPPIAIERSERHASAWYKDVPGGVLASAGLGGLAVGVTYLALANRDISAANTAKPISRFHELAAAGQRERTVGTVFTIAGGALAVGATVRYFLVARDRKPPDHVVSIAVDQTGAFAVWTGKF
jgi:tetratricopeptide (TPR) repeat protein